MKEVKPVVNYIDNHEFYAEMKEYHSSRLAAIAAGLPKPRIPPCIAQKFMMICNRLSQSRNFIPYGFREEMISDGILNCVQRIDNFDPAISTNPFAYFTQLAWFAFVRRIQIEKGQKKTAIDFTVSTYLTELMEIGSECGDFDEETGVNLSNRAMRLFSVDYAAVDKELNATPMQKKTTLAHQKRLAAKAEALQPKTGLQSIVEY